jgi:hypothetical protein
MPISFRGALAAGLTVAVVGGVSAWAVLTADAAPVSTPAVLAVPTVPPPGGDAAPLKIGGAGTSSAALAKAGLDGAPAATTATNTDALKAPPPPKSGPGTGSALKVQAAASTYYLYNMAQLTTDSDGGWADITIGNPKLAAADYHSLAEIAVQSEDGKQIVEVGWRVTNGGAGPRLFVYHWVNGKETCYNTCGFVPGENAPIAPGAVLAAGDVETFSISRQGAAWWVAYGGDWIGAFPDSLWGGRFTRAGYIQWFGEVAASVSRPCNNRTQMGNGTPATSASAATFSSITLREGQKDVPSTSITVYPGTGNVFPTQRVNNTSFRFGGPGVC